MKCIFAILLLQLVFLFGTKAQDELNVVRASCDFLINWNSI